MDEAITIPFEAALEEDQLATEHQPNNAAELGDDIAPARKH